MEFCSAGNAVSLAVDAGYMGKFPIIYRKNVRVCVCVDALISNPG